MATPKDKTQKSSLGPQEGVDKPAETQQANGLPDGAQDASADPGRAQQAEVAGDGEDVQAPETPAHHKSEQANGVVNGHHESDAPRTDGQIEGAASEDDDDGKRATVKIKGRPTGVAVELGEGDWAELIEVLAERLAAADGFFRGGKVVLEAGAHPLVEAQLREVRNVLEAHDMKLGVVLSTSERTLQAAAEVGLATTTAAGDVAPDDANAANAPDKPKPGASPNATAAPSRAARTQRLLQPQQRDAAPVPPPRPTGHFVHRGSLRSGQILRKAESIVVIGDVNPGAQVISSGDVIVWGRLRGIAYAGVDGNRRAVVAALDFVPTQLRIANLTAIAPQQKRGRGLLFWRKEPARRPEIARIAEDRIIVEPWDEAKIGKFSNW